jgi:hypothetical protein
MSLNIKLIKTLTLPILGSIFLVTGIEELLNKFGLLANSWIVMILVGLVILLFWRKF